MDTSAGRHIAAECKSASQGILESQDEFLVVFENVPLIMVIVDSERRVRRANRAAIEFGRRPPEEMIGLRGGEALRCLHSLDDPKCCGFGSFCEQCDIRRTVLDTFETGNSHYGVEAKLAISREGKQTELYLLVSTSPLNISGSQMALVCMEDVTERKQAEEAEKKLMQMKDELIASISHGLRTPIFSITGFLELLLDGKVEDPDTQREFLTRAAQDADRLRTLVNDLFDVSQLQAGWLGSRLEEVELNSLVKKTLKCLEDSAGKKGVTLTYADPGVAMTVKGDPDQLQRVLINLIGNAIKFSQKGSTVQVAGGLASGLATIKVIDQGPGIAAEELSKVFDRFYQTDGPNKRAGRGTGLGLHIAKKIIEAHGGYIGLESEPGRGSTFFFALPELVDNRDRCFG